MTERTVMTAQEEMDQVEFVNMLDKIQTGFNLFSALGNGDAEAVNSIFNRIGR